MRPLPPLTLVACFASGPWVGWGAAQAATPPPLVGKWNRSGSVHPHDADPATWGNAGTTSSRYEFRADGTYLFTERTFRMTHPVILVVREEGAYAVKERRLAVVPTSSVIRAYRKAHGGDELGDLVSTQARRLEPTTYTYGFHFFPGIQEWNLVLQAAAPTQRDGAFSGNTTYPNAWYFDQRFTNNDLTAARK